MNILSNPDRIPENYGIRIAVALAVYFLFMKMIGLSHHVELRLINLVILTVGVHAALRKFKQTHSDNLNYFRGLITGVATAGIGSVLFAVFLFLYMKADASLMRSVIDNEPMGRYLNAYMASFIVALEGFFSGLLVTFVLLNWVTTDEVNMPQQ